MAGENYGFQSTHSLRSATLFIRCIRRIFEVSIHALLAECDPDLAPAGQKRRGFNPRTPCGVRPSLTRIRGIKLWFQSTHSLRSATYEFTGKLTKGDVSIHALLAECDVLPRRGRKRRQCFNPRTPCGVRPMPQSAPVWTRRFQSTHSLRSATRFFFLLQFSKKFQSTHSLRSATDRYRAFVLSKSVSIHALLAECD